MKKFTWRLLALLLAMLFVMPMLAACNDPDDQPPDDGGGGEPTVEKEIDIYFIAGQSNAAGTTKIENADTIYADYPELKNGTDPYILYAGNSAGNSPNNTVTYNWGGVKMGLGSNANNFGPEVGMAKELSKYYNAETGKVAGIIKYTHGGTGLCNTEVNTEPDEKTGLLPGNWSPPSYSEHSPDDPELAYKGFLYRGFLDEAYKRLRELKDMGYTKINLKGLYWMQGCNDTWRYSLTPSAKKNPNWYPNAFACLVSDWRAELSDIMRSVQSNYGGAQDMPFFIGTISPTYRMGDASYKQGRTYSDNGEYLAATHARNDPFIAMQKKLAEDNTNCYVVDNGDYGTVRYTENLDGTVDYEVVGTDVSHWGQADCYEVGRNVGNMLLDICTDYQP